MWFMILGICAVVAAGGECRPMLLQSDPVFTSWDECNAAAIETAKHFPARGYYPNFGCEKYQPPTH
jgi:hypothetical protein